MNNIRSIVVGLSIVALAGCHKKPPESSSTLGGFASNLDTQRARLDGGNISDPSRSVIRSGSLGLRVKELDLAKKEIETIVVDTRGRIDAWSITDDRFLSMQLRIPEPVLEDAMNRIAGLGKVTSRSLHSADVTDQVIDLEARLTNLIALRDRLRKYLDKAADLKEILEVEKELARVQTDIEIFQRKLELLKAQIALSELSLIVRQR